MPERLIRCFDVAVAVLLFVAIVLAPGFLAQRFAAGLEGAAQVVALFFGAIMVFACWAAWGAMIVVLGIDRKSPGAAERPGVAQRG